ncbi:type II and III secretion system protein family protein [Phenylobacterium sp.]|uniref:type II and III secretion system protein family protein n=1 Tax=Phenylobacterium sp. TaxID=1871053 RepID=UPI002C5C37A9|nr:type II and III secretion system protein family protein [Phenylobacterium sp.]HVI31097.1 type II and III secretion system protein family protein [Phenylobacterium sp.]
MSRTLAGAFAATLALLAAAPAAADVFPSESAPSRVIHVPRDKSLSFRLDAPASKIVVAQPDTAEIVATTDHSFYVRGREYGSTNLLVYGPGGRLKEVIDVRVGYDAAALEDDLRRALPGEDVRVQTLGEGLLLTGLVSTPSVAARAKTLADRYAPDAVTSTLTVQAAQQVVLEVRVLEATRSALQDFGLSGLIRGNDFTFGYGNGVLGNSAPNGVLQISGRSGSVSFDLELQALEEKGVIRTLARPNLVAVSGEKASFLAGGEFPYPVPQDLDKITLEFRTYGVKLDFQPFVQDNGLIKLVVAPEVSQLDPANALRVNGISVPGLITRRTSTTVELKSGDSFAVAGLLQNDYQNMIRQFPVLGDIPVLSALFRSSRWKRNETELVIVVTPRLATATDVTAGHAATVGGSDPSSIDLILMGKALDKPLTRNPARKGK